MKGYWISLCSLALAGIAWAQTPGTVTIVADSATPLASAPAAVTGTAILGLGHHGDGGCGGCGHTTCMSVPAKKKTTKVEYSSVCEKICVPMCSCLFSRSHGSCDSCAEGACSHAYTRNYLVKRVRTEECDTYKCIPVEQPSCGGGRCTSASGCCTSGTVMAPSGAAPAPERVPAPLPKGTEKK
jgi:hypothetical protein